MKRTAVASCVILLSAWGANNNVWVKSGATQTDFAQDRFGCMEQSQHRVSSAYVNQYGGSSDSYVTTNNPLFSACMNARGWYLQQQPSQEQVAYLKTSVEAIKGEVSWLCSREDLRPYYSKTSCLPEETTLEQLADKSRITNTEKTALNKVRTEMAAINKRMNEAIRQANPQGANTVIAARDAAVAEQDKNALDFYEGRLTRGDYNKRRQEIANRLNGRV